MYCRTGLSKLNARSAPSKRRTVCGGITLAPPVSTAVALSLTSSTARTAAGVSALAAALPAQRQCDIISARIFGKRTCSAFHKGHGRVSPPLVRAGPLPSGDSAAAVVDGMPESVSGNLASLSLV